MKNIILCFLFVNFCSIAFADPFDGKCQRDYSIQTVITEVAPDKYQGFNCKAQNYNEWFTCGKISPFDDGSVVPGLKITLHIRFEDICHIPGGCGGRCYAFANPVLDLKCNP